MAQVTIEQAFQAAVRHHQRDQLPQAETLCRQILAAEPNHADGLHLLGIIANKVGQNDLAVDLIRRSIALKPNNAEAHNNLGNALKDKGQADAAIASYQRAIALNPNFPEAYNNLGNALKDKGQLEDAIVSYRHAIALKPLYAEAYSNLGHVLSGKGQLDEAIAVHRQAVALEPSFPGAHYNLGNALGDKGLLDQAMAAYSQALALNPNFPEAQYNLGITLKDKGQIDQAIIAYRQAITLKPNFPEAVNNLGLAFKEKGCLDEATTAFRQAIALNPSFSDAHNNLGMALREAGLLDEAISACRKGIALKPHSAEAYSNLGTVLGDSGRLDEAIVACRQAVALNPNSPEAHLNVAFALLTKGHFPEGWEEYEWRWTSKEFSPFQRNFSQPLWDGQPLAGATLLLHAEQGFGDTLHAIRYVPMAAQRGGKIIVECQAELVPLIRPLATGCQVVPQGQPLPPFDLHCPMLSLPRVFGTTLENIPHDVPYLHADAEATEKWRKRLAGDTNPIKVGLCWTGNKGYKNDRNRSMALSALAPLAGLRGISFYSLQKNEPATQAVNPPPGLRIIRLTEDRKSFADTAGLIANLDLIISVETSVVQLAGAMAKPVWVLLAFAPDWRWMLEREDSPWYPTMRLFRQTKPGDWDDVVGRVTEALAGLAR